MLCATNRVPIPYELAPANVAEVSLTEELLAEGNLSEDTNPHFRRTTGFGFRVLLEDWVLSSTDARLEVTAGGSEQGPTPIRFVATS